MEPETWKAKLLKVSNLGPTWSKPEARSGDEPFHYLWYTNLILPFNVKASTYTLPVLRQATSQDYMGDCFQRSSRISAWIRQPWLTGCSCKSKKRGWPVRIPKKHSRFHRNRICRFRKRGRFFGPALDVDVVVVASQSPRFWNLRKSFCKGGKILDPSMSRLEFSFFSLSPIEAKVKGFNIFWPQLLDDKILTRRKSRERRRRNNQSLKNCALLWSSAERNHSSHSNTLRRLLEYYFAPRESCYTQPETHRIVSKIRQSWCCCATPQTPSLFIEGYESRKDQLRRTLEWTQPRGTRCYRVMIPVQQMRFRFCSDVWSGLVLCFKQNKHFFKNNLMQRLLINATAKIQIRSSHFWKSEIWVKTSKKSWLWLTDTVTEKVFAIDYI